jgi:hypothetical protein
VEITMPRVIRTLTRAVALATLTLPAVALAQPRTGVSRLIDARRELDLTPRQLVQLDSIERAQFAERRAQEQGMTQRRDSVRREMESLRGVGPDSLRAIARSRMEAMRPRMEQARRRDSATMAAAERVLTEPQRQRLREMRAEERGFQRGLRQGQVRGMQGRGAPDRALRERQSRERPMVPRDIRERAMREREMRGGEMRGRAIPDRPIPDRPLPERRLRRPDAV